MFRTLFKVMIIYMTVLQFYNQQSNICKGFGRCRCYKRKGKLEIRCSGIDKFDKLLPSILQKFSHRTIKSISIDKCKNRMLSKNIFKNVTIPEINFKCPFKIIHPESLMHVNCLTKLKMRFTNLRKVPYGIQRLHNLKVLDMQDGRLTKIENYFKNMTFLQNLNLRGNKIAYIYKGAFRNNKDLNRIDLSYNRIRYLHVNIIRFNLNLREFLIGYNELLSTRRCLKDTHLTVLDLRGNKIQSIEQIFGNVSYLESLDLGMNFNLKPTDFSFSIPFNPLEVLKMDRCLLKELPPKLLKPMKYLEHVDFSFNELQSVPEKFFYGLRNLISVNLKSNKIMHLGGVFKGNTNLQTLFANLNNISKIGRAFKYTKFLQTLDLSNNSLEAIDEEDFKHSNSLMHLNLNYNRISNITTKAFVALKKLTFLELSSNTIYSLNGSLQSVRNLQFLILRHNQMEKIDEFDFKYMNQLKVLDLSFNTIRSAKKAFRSLVNLRTLIINGNNLTTMSRNSFPPEIHISTLEATGNRWICDCRLLWLRDLLADNIVSDGFRMRCSQPLRFQEESLRRMPAENLVMWSDSCPPSCKCDCVPEDEEFFVKVDCSWRKLTKAPILLPKKTRELYLEENLLTKSITLEVDNYVWLRTINLKGNRLNHINLGQFGNLTSLLLARNHLRRFFSNPPEHIMKWTLSGNPWICDCEAVKFRKWLLSHHTKIPDINETRCIWLPGREDIANKAIILLSEEDLCPPSNKLYFTISAVVLAVVLLLAAVCFLIFSGHSFKIKAWLFSRGMTCLKQEMDGDSRKKYDAFISAADEDMPLVQNFIIPELEQKAPFYSLFEPSRNLSAEEAWDIDKLMEAVVNSKRIMVLLSENYVKNNFLVEFLNGISDYFVDGGLHRMIPITVGNFLSLSDFDLTVQTAVQSQRCLRVGQKLFWEMLRYSMPFKNIEDVEDTESRRSTEQLIEQ